MAEKHSNSISERLRELRKTVKLSVDDIAATLGLSRSGYYHLENGNVEISVKHLSKLESQYQFNPSYIIKAELPRFIEIQKNQDDNGNLFYREKINGYQHLVAPVSVNAGIAISLTQEWLDRDFVKFSIPGIKFSTFTFKICGDSMEPDFQDGDYVITTKVEDRNTIKSGSVMVIVTRYGLYLKLLKFEDDGIYLVSLNGAYRPISVENDEIKELYRPVQKISKYP